MSEKEFRTPDMTLVIHLCCKHMVYERVELNGDEATWFFRETPALTKEVDTYRDGHALVEPVAFLRRRARVLREVGTLKEQQKTAAA